MKWTLPLCVSLVILTGSGCDSNPAAAAKRLPEDAQNFVFDLEHNTLPSRGESHFLKLPSEEVTLFVELRGLKAVPEIAEVALTEADRLNGVTERYDIIWGRATAVRAAMVPDPLPERLDWSPWFDIASAETYLQELTAPGLELSRESGVLVGYFDPNYTVGSTPKQRRGRMWFTHKPKTFSSDELRLLSAQ